MGEALPNWALGMWSVPGPKMKQILGLTRVPSWTLYEAYLGPKCSKFYAREEEEIGSYEECTWDPNRS